MRARFKVAWAGLMGGAILLGTAAARSAGADEVPPAPSSVAGAEDNSNPYAVISDANVFRLNTPPPAAGVDTGPPPDLPVVTLSGFIRDADHVKVLMAVKIKDPTKAKELQEVTSYLTLAEGEKDGVVELVKVHAEAEEVDIMNSGTPMTLTMKANGFESHSSEAPAGRGTPAMRQIPGAPPVMPMQTAAPGAGGAAPGENYGGGATIIGGPSAGGGGGFGGGGGGSSIIGGASAYSSSQGTAVNTAQNFSQQQTSFGSASRNPGGTVISGGASPIAANNPGNAGMTAIPLNAPLSNPSSMRPNFTPVGSGIPKGVPMPPIPGGQQENQQQ
jgi:hypothetical protein